ncbi:hypothetical protein K3495_g3303 [Podosphaera aphanis]|nr:hypothetical protein K3495_g3303 [Podosphaera aphanis]
MMSSGAALEERFEILKDIGDGSFGSVVLARVRAAGSSVARRGTLIAIKTMKKKFESFAPCLELREVVFLSTLPPHPHLVPALDIFLDPYSKKLHIAMEYMDGNLYQLMKAREHRCLDVSSVKSILFQIMQGLEHIHAHHFFHRDIKPENILISSSSHQETGSSFRRYSSLMTPPSTPPTYSVKIADFGLARETHSKLNYTTYVSTRWYRAPEVLLRAGEYSSPVDIWAIGAMAVEIATLKPLFPGGNEVDQVWRVCEIMGSPGNWHSKNGARVGGGEWKEGTRLASKLGFSFPKMAPHSIDTILQTPQWPSSLSKLVTWCLMWDPQCRPSSTQALSHEFFYDAVDPLQPKVPASKILGRKQSDLNHRGSKDMSEIAHTLTSKSSWFRKSLINRTESPNDLTITTGKESIPQRPSVLQPELVHNKCHPSLVNKRSNWSNGASHGPPMPILPSIRPISPLSNAATAQANRRTLSNCDIFSPAQTLQQLPPHDNIPTIKIGRQLSVASVHNNEAEIHRLEAEMALTGSSGLVSPSNGQRESFFSHLRKRARRFSGKQPQIPITPKSMDIETHAGCGPWASNRSSMIMDGCQATSPIHKVDTREALDRALRNIHQNLESPTGVAGASPNQVPTSIGFPKRHHSLPQHARSIDNMRATASNLNRARRSQIHGGTCHYETPEEEDELLDEELSKAQIAMKMMQSNSTHSDTRQVRHTNSITTLSNPYLTPSPSASDPALVTSTQNTKNNKRQILSPTNFQDNEWAASAAASIFAASTYY